MTDHRQLRCPCGDLLAARTDDELVQIAQAHLESEHPNLSSKYTKQHKRYRDPFIDYIDRD
jgi:hypothetical protein